MRQPATLVLTGLLLAGLAGAPYTAAASDGADDRRSVSVTGNGEVLAMPDRARVQLGVEARDTDLGAAREQVNTGVREFLDFARTLDIDDRHIDSTDLSVQPEYEWDADARRREFVGYRVSRSITIELTELERLGQLMEGAVERGINRVSPPTLDAGDRREHQREALARAAEDARANAATLAETLGVRLGEVREVETREHDYGPVRERPQMMMMSADSGAGSDDQTYSAGELKFSATVRARFDLIVD